ncbi:HEAT repeat domain-containing protein [Novipirellula artificiosorum]|uniref:HEAT repeat protein n=1 Tax=Novipirellula artificiosorum TaxID=2528016 RepID=A0A5C6D5L6_9BACT|nr:HEAT repeat domain-containing protein [Novipirellula artificiosorum]TWU31011.1 HEAT repeat protein [Novipirellula artificiosorum]
MKLTSAILAILLGVAIHTAAGPIAFAQDDASSDLVSMVIELLADDDPEMRALALEQVRTTAAGEVATEQFAAQLPKLSGDAQVGLIRALAKRGDAAARPAILERMAGSSDSKVVEAGIESLGWLGNVTDVPTLIRWLGDDNPSQREAARRSLVRLQDAAVPAAIVGGITSSSAPMQATLIGILAERRALDAIPAILDAATNGDPSVRGAAMVALAELAGPEHLTGMLKGVLAAERGREQEAAEKAVMAVCNRIEDTGEQATPLLDAIRGFSASEQLVLLPTVGRVGGKQALADVMSAVRSTDPARHAIGVRALCNWPNASVAPELIDLIQSGLHDEHRISATRALIRVAPLADGRSDLEKLALLQRAMELSERDTERALVLKRAAAVRIPESLRFLLPYTDLPKSAEEACLAIVELAHHRSLREPNQVEFEVALNKVIATSQDATVVDRARRYIKGETWVRPK